MSLLTRSPEIGIQVFTRLVHPDFIIHGPNISPLISTHHLVIDCTVQRIRRHMIVTSNDMIGCLVGTRGALNGCFGTSKLIDETIKTLTEACYSICECKVASYEWTVVTGADELIYKLCEAINNELFF